MSLKLPAWLVLGIARHDLRDAPIVTSSVVEQSLTDAVLDLRDGVAQLLGDGLTFKRFDGVGVRCGGHDDKGNHRNG